MPRKSMDISLVEEEKSDLTFFNIEEEEMCIRDRYKCRKFNRAS